MSTSRGCILVVGEPMIRDSRLAELLRERGFDVLDAADADAAATQLRDLTEPPELAIVGLKSADPANLGNVRALRTAPGGRHVPILGVAGENAVDLDIRLLRSWGITGVVAATLHPELVVQRISRLVHPDPARTAERASCFVPVQVERLGNVTQEYALDLSVGGMRITCDDRIELNDDLNVRFQLPLVARDLITARARVVHQAPKRNSAGKREAGIFFYPMPARFRRLIEVEVTRLLSS
jgi:DNA-binding response OmpR family regulator